MEKDYDKAKYSQKDLWWAIGKVAVGVVFLTTIYYEFRDGQAKQLSDEQEFLEIRQLIKDSEHYTNDRIDKKTDRNKEIIDKNTNDIETLKLPNSDNE